MNHTLIATEALRYRLVTLADGADPSVHCPSFDVAEAGERAVRSAHPAIDRAIRLLGTAWVQAGLPPARLIEPWNGEAVDALFADRPDLVDAIDDIAAALTLSV